MSICSVSVSDDDIANSGSENLDSLGLRLTAYDGKTYDLVFETPDYIDLPTAMG